MGLIYQFILVNGHFTLNLLTALVCFAVAWLYYDAWKGRKDKREGTKALGFILLSLSFVFHSTVIEQTLLSTPLLGGETVDYFTTLFRVSGYLVLIVGQLIDPLQPLPEYRVKGFGKKNKGMSKAVIVPFIAITLGEFLAFSYPLFAVFTAFLYLRRATVGLEYHLRPISLSLFFLVFSETISLASTFRNTTNVILSNLVAPFGLVWIFEHLLLAAFAYILGKWIWGYLLKRLRIQLLIVFTTLTLIIFLVTTVFFTTTSIANIRDSTLESLKINVKVLQFTIDSKKTETLSDVQMVAQNNEVVEAVLDKSRKALIDITQPILLAKKQTFLVITNENGRVLARADDPDKSMGSMSDDQLVKRALDGDSVSSIIIKDGSIAPDVSVRAAAPIYFEDEVIGTVAIGILIDSAFVDGLKDATGLDASIYGDNIRSATTFIAPDNKSRWIGIKEETPAVKKVVLLEGEDYVGSVNILNVPFYSAFTPLMDVDNNPVGMLFVGTPQVSLLQAASKSIELTFLVTAGLLVLSVFPAYYVSKFIISQIK